MSSAALDFLGIARERRYSPGKVEADRAILDAVAARLGRAFRVRVVSGEEPWPEIGPSTRVFAMCQGPGALAALERWERAGIRVVNSAAGIAAAHRHRMLAAFARRGIAHPPSAMVDTAAPSALPAWIEAEAWVKRGDVHATEADDVVRVGGRAAAAAALEAMHRRGIGTACIQRHLGGNVFKFYAVRGRFFAGFAPPACAGLAASEERSMRALAEAGADALGLEVFGGDCIRDDAGGLWLIDLNDWPSYGPCRSVASKAIAAYLTSLTDSQ